MLVAKNRLGLVYSAFDWAIVLHILSEERLLYTKTSYLKKVSWI